MMFGTAKAPAGEPDSTSTRRTAAASFFLPTKVAFGNGALLSLPGILVTELSVDGRTSPVAGNGQPRVLLVADSGLAALGVVDRLSSMLENAGISVAVFAGVRPEPLLADVDGWAENVRAGRFDAVIGFGGGSSLDVAKLLAALATNPGSIGEYLGVEKLENPGLPTMLIPTTAGTGAEVTPNAIVVNPERGLKEGVVSRHLFARVAVVDPELIATAPAGVVATAGMDALAHAVESFLSVRATPLSDLFAAEACRRIVASLDAVVRAAGRTEVGDGDGRPAVAAAREDVMLGSMLAGIALTHAGTTLAHAMSYPLGARFGVPHGMANAILLPHVLAFNERWAAERLVQLAAAAKVPGSFVDAVSDLAGRIRIPERLADVGVPASAAPELARGTMDVARLIANNPRPVTETELTALFEKVIV